MTELAAQILVMATAPAPGLVMSGLTPPFTPAEAAALAGPALGDTMDAVRHAPVVRRVVALAGRPGPWLPEGFDVVVQRGGSPDERIAAAMRDAYAALPLPVVLIGMDTPQVTSALLEEVAGKLASAAAGAVLGPAEDGGFWLLGLRRPDPALTLGIPVPEPAAARAQLVRLIQAGLRVHLAPGLARVSTMNDAARVARQAPGSRFTAALAATLSAPAEPEPGPGSPYDQNGQIDPPGLAAGVTAR